MTKAEELWFTVRDSLDVKEQYLTFEKHKGVTIGSSEANGLYGFIETEGQRHFY